MMRIRWQALVAASAVGMLLSGCYYPGGGLFSSTEGPQTYVSTESLQKSVTMVDTRTGEVFFSIDIPPGKQLVIDFERGEGDDPVYTPDLLLYDVFDAGKTTGSLGNSMTVPPAAARRIDMTVVQAPAFRPGADGPVSPGEISSAPAWWSPEGGKIDRDYTGVNVYDD